MTYMERVWSRVNLNGLWFAKDWIFGVWFNWVIRPYYRYTIGPAMDILSEMLRFFAGPIFNMSGEPE